jgi:hypothetical protein
VSDLRCQPPRMAYRRFRHQRKRRHYCSALFQRIA